MQAHLITVVAITALVAFSLWRRLRTTFGLQQIRRNRLIGRIVLLAVVAALFIGSSAMLHPSMLEGVAAGALAGVALGLLGIRLTRFEIDPVKGDCYIPNVYIGGAVTLLFLGRMLWRFVALSPQMGHPGAAPLHGPDMGQSPLTMAVFGLTFAYYITYCAGLLVHHGRILRARVPA